MKRTEIFETRFHKYSVCRNTARIYECVTLEVDCPEDNLSFRDLLHSYGEDMNIHLDVFFHYRTQDMFDMFVVVRDTKEAVQYAVDANGLLTMEERKMVLNNAKRVLKNYRIKKNINSAMGA